MTMTPQEKEFLSTHYFEINSHCGRVYELSLMQVARDYAQYLVGADGITRKQAMDQMGVDDVESWFYSQYSWEDIDNQAKLVKHPSEAQILNALNLMRGGGRVGDDSTLKKSVRQDAKIKRRKLGRLAPSDDGDIPGARAAPKL